MAINPSHNGSALNDPTKRANEINDPQFANQQGYFPYDLTHQEFVTPRFGEVTPSMSLNTVPADRIVMHDNTKTIHTQINGNLLSTVNQYVDSFYVPMRSLFPNNYEKLIPNPNKGQDLPNMALPQFPIADFVKNYLRSDRTLIMFDPNSTLQLSMKQMISNPVSLNAPGVSVLLSRLTLLATVFSRGQLLDYFGCCFDTNILDRVGNGGSFSQLQSTIDNYFDALFTLCFNKILIPVEVDLDSDEVSFTSIERARESYTVSDVMTFRDALSSSFEKGKYIYFSDVSITSAFVPFIEELIRQFTLLFGSNEIDFDNYVSNINTDSNPFNVGFISLEKPLAYQQCIAQYFTNDTVDNIFNSDLFMQLLRSVMYPADSNGYTKEPTFTYNGVSTEYDYISCGALYFSLIKPSSGVINRQYVWMTLMLLLRRSLRYGDYFSTARPNMLAVGQLSIDVTNNAVSPIDVTKNLLMQRYLNAVNYIGSGFLQYFASIYGVTPSDTGTYPRFIAHRKIELVSDIVTNTSNNQGAQTTNLVGYSDDNAFDVFIDDIGVIINVVSYDVLPVYTSGIDSTFHLADRFDFFNPMLQNIGDQPIRVSEIHGKPDNRSFVFGYTMRNAEYKYKLSRAHGAFVNSLQAYLLKYPYSHYSDNDGAINIDPDFIRDKPVYMDSVVSSMTGTSPANYYHFIVSCLNQLHCARKIQATPPVLF